MRLSTYALIVVFPINIALNALLVYHTALGVMASPIAVSITYWLSFLFLVIFTIFFLHSLILIPPYMWGCPAALATARGGRLGPHKAEK